jgi:phage terminase large subunit GpA-like protein
VFKETLLLDKSLSWMPDEIRDLEGSFVYRSKLSKSELKIYKKKKAIKVSEWAEQNRIMISGPREGLYWDNSFFPHLVGILNASFFPSVQMIGNCKAPQSGGTSVVETSLGYIADRKPGLAMIVYPDRDTSVKKSMDSIQPMFRRSPSLKKLLTKYRDDMAGIRIKLLSMLIYMAWAGSVTSIGNVTAKYLCLDEVDKYKEFASKKEAAVMDLVLKRVTVYTYGRKVWLTSTPTLIDGVIWNYLTNIAQVVFDYWVKCPECCTFQIMEFKRIKFNGIKDPVRMEAEKPAYYECFKCGAHWGDGKRRIALQNGEWRAREESGEHRELMKYLTEERPVKICFHTPAWISNQVSLSECAAAFLYGLKSKPAMKNFRTQIEAMPWVDYRVDRKLTDIVALKDDRPQASVPDNDVTQVLLAAVDTQDKGFWYEVRAWGWGEEMESWQVKSGFVESFTGLAKILFTDEYHDASGKPYKIFKTAIDAMGHRTKEVYEFCRKYQGRIIPLQGVQKPQYNWSPTRISRYPGTTKPLPWEIWLYRINTSSYKDSLATKLQINGSDIGAWHLNKDVTEGWCRQMTVEFINDAGKWESPAGKANHAWDVSVYMMFIADFCEVYRWKKPDNSTNKTKTKTLVKKKRSSML